MLSKKYIFEKLGISDNESVSDKNSDKKEESKGEKKAEIRVNKNIIDKVVNKENKKLENNTLHTNELLSKQNLNRSIDKAKKMNVEVDRKLNQEIKKEPDKILKPEIKREPNKIMKQDLNKEISKEQSKEVKKEVNKVLKPEIKKEANKIMKQDLNKEISKEMKKEKDKQINTMNKASIDKNKKIIESNKIDKVVNKKEQVKIVNVKREEKINNLVNAKIDNGEKLAHKNDRKEKVDNLIPDDLETSNDLETLFVKDDKISHKHREVRENSFNYTEEMEIRGETPLEDWMSIANVIQNEGKPKDKVKESLDKSDLAQNEVVQRAKDALFEMRAWSNDNAKDDGVFGNNSLENKIQGEKIMVNNPLESKDKIQTVEEIYQNSQMEVDRLKMIFMVDEFSRTLPENLPVDIKRNSVKNIIGVSGMKVENFLNDAYKRMDALNQVLEHSVQKTEDIIAQKREAIKSLESEIAKLEQFISDREQFQDKQTSLIEYEVQRIVSIVDFIKP